MMTVTYSTTARKLWHLAAAVWLLALVAGRAMAETPTCLWALMPNGGLNCVTPLTAGLKGPQGIPGPQGPKGDPGITVASTTISDLLVTLTAPNTLTVSGGRVRFGFVAPVTFTLTATSSSSNASAGGMVYLYVNPDAKLTAYSTISNAILSCAPAAACSVITAGNAFQDIDSVPVASWTASAGQWDAAGGTDFRSFFGSGPSFVPGTGIAFASQPGQLVIQTDTSIVAVRVTTPAASNSTCVLGNYAVGGGFFYQCVETNSWMRVTLASW